MVLSVPYLGSNCLELGLEGAGLGLRATFSTLPRVELPGAHVPPSRRSLAFTSFSTLPRVELPGAAHRDAPPVGSYRLSVPYLGSNCLERRRLKRSR